MHRQVPAGMVAPHRWACKHMGCRSAPGGPAPRAASLALARHTHDLQRRGKRMLPSAACWPPRARLSPGVEAVEQASTCCSRQHALHRGLANRKAIPRWVTLTSTRSRTRTRSRTEGQGGCRPKTRDGRCLAPRPPTRTASAAHPPSWVPPGPLPAPIVTSAPAGVGVAGDLRGAALFADRWAELGLEGVHRSHAASDTHIIADKQTSGRRDQCYDHDIPFTRGGQRAGWEVCWGSSNKASTEAGARRATFARPACCWREASQPPRFFSHPTSSHQVSLPP